MRSGTDGETALRRPHAHVSACHVTLAAPSTLREIRPSTCGPPTLRGPSRHESRYTRERHGQAGALRRASVHGSRASCPPTTGRGVDRETALCAPAIHGLLDAGRWAASGPRAPGSASSARGREAWRSWVRGMPGWRGALPSSRSPCAIAVAPTATRPRRPRRHPALTDRWGGYFNSRSLCFTSGRVGVPLNSRVSQFLASGISHGFLVPREA